MMETSSAGVVLNAADEIDASYAGFSVLRDPWCLPEPYQRASERSERTADLGESGAQVGAQAAHARKRKRKRRAPSPGQTGGGDEAPHAALSLAYAVSSEAIRVVATAHQLLCQGWGAAACLHGGASNAGANSSAPAAGSVTAPVLQHPNAAAAEADAAEAETEGEEGSAEGLPDCLALAAMAHVLKPKITIPRPLSPSPACHAASRGYTGASPVEAAAAGRPASSTHNLFNTLVEAPESVEVVAGVMGSEGRVLLPCGSRFLMSDLQRLQPLLEGALTLSHLHAGPDTPPMQLTQCLLLPVRPPAQLKGDRGLPLAPCCLGCSSCNTAACRHSCHCVHTCATHPLTRPPADARQPGGRYDLVVLDPPWENASAARSGAYSTLAPQQLLALPLRELLRQVCRRGGCSARCVQLFAWARRCV